MSRLRILLVEDLDSDVELTRYALKRGGVEAEVLQVLTEAEFRAALNDFDPQLVVSDFSLPRFDGLSALAISLQERPALPFIFMSGSIGEQRAEDAIAKGAAAYVVKGDYAGFVAQVRRLTPDRGN